MITNVQKGSGGILTIDHQIIGEAWTKLWKGSPQLQLPANISDLYLAEESK